MENNKISYNQHDGMENHKTSYDQYDGISIKYLTISMMGWNTRTRSPRIQHGLASVDEHDAETRR